MWDRPGQTAPSPGLWPIFRIDDVDTALTKIISEVEHLSTQANAPQLVSSLLKQFDVVTGLSAWSDPKHTH